MDRGALMGGAAVLAALVGAGLFYLVLSGDPVEVDHEHQRVTHEVEKLQAKGESITLAGSKPETKRAKPERDGMREAMRKHPPNPEGAAAWAQKRAALRMRDQRLAGEQLEDFFRVHQFPKEKQLELWEIFNANFELRNTIRNEIEEGVLSPRVGRKRLAAQREQMKKELLEKLTEEQFNELATRMDKIRVVLF